MINKRVLYFFLASMALVLDPLSAEEGLPTSLSITINKPGLKSDPEVYLARGNLAPLVSASSKNPSKDLRKAFDTQLKKVKDGKGEITYKETVADPETGKKKTNNVAVEVEMIHFSNGTAELDFSGPEIWSYQLVFIAKKSGYYLEKTTDGAIYILRLADYMQYSTGAANKPLTINVRENEMRELGEQPDGVTVIFQSSAFIKSLTPKFKTEKWPNKKLKRKTRLILGKKEGIEEWYYKNGKLEKQVPYHNDEMKFDTKEYGPYMEYVYNTRGIKQQVYSSTDIGLETLEFTFFRKGGKEWEHGTIDNGSITKNIIHCLDSYNKEMGSLTLTSGGKYVWNGIGTYQKAVTVITRKEEPRLGYITAIKLEMPGGKAYAFSYDDDGFISRVTQYENDKPVLDESLLNGKRNGVTKYYKPAGVIVQDEMYKNGVKSGYAHFYYENGKTSMKISYKADMEEGLSYGYFENGALQWKRSSKKGLMQWQEYYYPEGGKSRKETVVWGQTKEKGGKVTAFEKQRKNEEFYPNGKKKSIETYKNGKKEGTFSEFFENGKTASVMPYKNDLLHGNVIHYYENGKIKDKTTYSSGMAQGKAVYYNEAEKILKEEYFDKGMTKGWTEYQYHVNGKPEFKFPYNDQGQKHGMEEWYNEKGKLTHKLSFTEGSQEGYSFIYFENGKIQYKTPYKNNQMHGTMEIYDEKGKLLKKIEYENGVELSREEKPVTKTTSWPNGKTKTSTKYVGGKKEGTEYFYYSNGNLELETPYTQGLANGTENKYYEDGKLQRTAVYAMGKREGTEIQYYEDGKTVMAKIPYKNDKIHGVHEQYGPDGSLTAKYFYTDGVQTGKEIIPQVFYFTDNWPNGNVRSKIPYLNAMKQGTELWYYEDGTKHKEIPWDKDKREGTAIEYYPNGKIAVKDEYRNNLRHGIYEEYDDRGNLLYKASYENGKLIKVEKEREKAPEEEMEKEEISR
ncbi:MAG: hypothetical protein JW969_12865 [Spirochaetales bacterium]|nr:hypothetical protein [Spirochaetales bacterium]